MTEKLKKEHLLRVRLSAQELRKLEFYAKKRGANKSWVIHEYIRRLPNPPLEFGG